MGNYFHRNQQTTSKQELYTKQIYAVTQDQYLKWWDAYNQFISRISYFYSQKSDHLLQSLLLPNTMSLISEGSLCGERHYLAVLQFDKTSGSIDGVIKERQITNEPFGTQQLWFLLYKLTKAVTILHEHSAVSNLCPKLIVFTDKEIKISVIYGVNGEQKDQEDIQFIDESCLSDQAKGLISKLDKRKRNDDFAIGMTLIQCMLLKKSNIYRYDKTSNSKKIDIDAHQKIVQELLELTYYPLKLRVIVAGLAQMDPHNHRLSSEEVNNLLETFNVQIINCSSFHLKKSQLVRSFGVKFTNLQKLLQRVKIKRCKDVYRLGFLPKKDDLDFNSSSVYSTSQHHSFKNLNHKNTLTSSLKRCNHQMQAQWRIQANQIVQIDSVEINQEDEHEDVPKEYQNLVIAFQEEKQQSQGKQIGKQDQQKRMGQSSKNMQKQIGSQQILKMIKQLQGRYKQVKLIEGRRQQQILDGSGKSQKASGKIQNESGLAKVQHGSAQINAQNELSADKILNVNEEQIVQFEKQREDKVKRQGQIKPQVQTQKKEMSFNESNVSKILPAHFTKCESENSQFSEISSFIGQEQQRQEKQQPIKNKCIRHQSIIDKLIDPEYQLQEMPKVESVSVAAAKMMEYYNNSFKKIPVDLINKYEIGSSPKHESLKKTFEHIMNRNMEKIMNSQKQFPQ